MGVRDVSLSPDGKRIAFCASVNEPVQSYTQPDLWVVDLTPEAKPRNLTANYDGDMCSGLTGDQAAPRSPGQDHVAWSADGNSLFAISLREGSTNLVQVETNSGKMTEVTRGDHAVMRFRQVGAGGNFLLLISTPTSIGDLFLVD